MLGDVNLLGVLDLRFIDGFSPVAGQTFAFVRSTGLLTHDFADVQLRGLAEGFEYELGVTNGALLLTALNDGVAVPEAATAVLGALASLIVCCVRNRCAGRYEHHGILEVVSKPEP